MMAEFQAEENLTGRAPKKCAKNSGRYPPFGSKSLGHYTWPFLSAGFTGFGVMWIQ